MKIAVFIILILFPILANAAPDTPPAMCRIAVKYLDLPESQKAYADKENSYALGFCMGLVLGAIQTYDGLENTPNIGYTKPQMLCLPSNYNLEQGARVFVKWLDTHPEQDVTDAPTAGILTSHLDAFPCKK